MMWVLIGLVAAAAAGAGAVLAIRWRRKRRGGGPINEPATVTRLKRGDRVTIDKREMEDWIYSAGNDRNGGFSIEILAERVRG